MRDRFFHSGGGLPGMPGAVLADSSPSWWDELFAGRARRCPFLVDWPDENLAAWLAACLLTPGLHRPASV